MGSPQTVRAKGACLISGSQPAAYQGSRRSTLQFLPNRLFHNMKQSFILTSQRFYLQWLQRQANSPPLRNEQKELICHFPHAFESSAAGGAMTRAPASRCRRRFGSFCTSANTVPRRASPSLPTNLL